MSDHDHRFVVQRDGMMDGVRSQMSPCYAAKVGETKAFGSNEHEAFWNLIYKLRMSARRVNR